MSRHANGTLVADSDPLTVVVATAPFGLTDASPEVMQYAGWRDSTSAGPAAPCAVRGVVIDAPLDRYFPNFSRDENRDRFHDDGRRHRRGSRLAGGMTLSTNPTTIARHRHGQRDGGQRQRRLRAGLGPDQPRPEVCCPGLRQTKSGRRPAVVLWR
jgi:hypothetical protein